MKSICITGAVQSNLQTVADILQQAGMKQPEPARRDNDSVDIAFWHEQVMALAAEDSSVAQPISNPGRLWEQLASDIFVANIKSKVWGWSNTRSTWLLNYWLDFEPHLNFILICVSPQQMLASAMASVSDTISIEMIMNNWQAHHQELLRFHYRNPQRSLLVDFNECIHYPEDLIKRCIEQWKLPLATPSETCCYEIANDSVAIYLAHQLCQDHPQIASLQHELAATITRLRETDQVIYTMTPTPAQIIAGYRALRDRSTELQQVQAANEALNVLKTQHDNVIADHTQQQRNTDAKLKEAIQENELLLLQLYKLKEELETTFLKHGSQQAQINALTQANAALTEEKSALTTQRNTFEQQIKELTQTRNEQAKLASERQSGIEALTQERDSHANHAAKQQAQINTLTQANAALTEEKLALTTQRNTFEQEIRVLTQARDEQGKLAAERQSKIEALTQERNNHANHAAKQQAQINTLTQANAALTEEKSALTTQRNTFEQQIRELTQARNEQAKLASERQSKIEALTQERDNHVSHAAKQQAQINALTQANAALTEEKSALTTQRNTFEQEIRVLTQARDEQSKLAAERQSRIEALTQERDSHASHAAERQAQINALTQANAALTEEKLALAQTQDEQACILVSCQAQIEKLNKTQAENSELLLLELHQAHLESEQYFQQHQEALTRLQATEARWQRLLQRNPTYFDYESIEILPAPSAKNSVVAWRLTNFSTAGRHLPILEFKTSLEYGTAGLIFPRPADGDSLLTRWPAAANQQNELILMPVGTKATHQQRAEILFDLATSDWILLEPLTTLLIKTLTSSTILKEHTDFQLEAFRKGLDMFLQIIQKFPPILRYDQVQLKREQVISGYEHLWLHFDNLSFDGKHWSEFEFRLACSNVQPDRFGFHPKLEFPEEGGQAPFEAWFSESCDDFGAKLELRFEQPDAMDMAIWKRLTEHDHIFLAALIKRLPAILGTLQSLNVQIKRPWADWIKMAREIQRIAALCTATVPPTPPIALIQPAAPETSTSPSKEPKQLLELSSTVKTGEKPLRRKPALKTKAAKPAIASETREV